MVIITSGTIVIRTRTTSVRFFCVTRRHLFTTVSHFCLCTVGTVADVRRVQTRLVVLQRERDGVLGTVELVVVADAGGYLNVRFCMKVLEGWGWFKYKPILRDPEPCPPGHYRRCRSYRRDLQSSCRSPPASASLSSINQVRVCRRAFAVACPVFAKQNGSQR